MNQRKETLLTRRLLALPGPVQPGVVAKPHERCLLRQVKRPLRRRDGCIHFMVAVRGAHEAGLKL